MFHFNLLVSDLLLKLLVIDAKPLYLFEHRFVLIQKLPSLFCEIVDLGLRALRLRIHLLGNLKNISQRSTHCWRSGKYGRTGQ